LKRLFFRKNQRLRTNEQFKSVLDRNCCVRNSDMLLFTAENDCDYPRLGVSVSKACGNAVVRNRVKRLVREAFRNNQHQLAQKYDYLVIAAKPRGKKPKNTANKQKNPLFTAKTEEIDQMFLKLAVSGAEKAIRTAISN
jgi:ribonuclease P protein component